ncbi:inositolphosphotransferase NDAI_0A03650 [Naumovozyma dairenensis CBS 421]|uniref:Inositolphosphotransferase Aur1/Ipt1 domain-containing protein n=1 Tax=Naumovozyma dairenensis (strain ATCC 10597 / BCRC 20456 / CBS 421 / NBRC 0211 / NRRL Y-12639) TaxID=1071378 RepID=G0W3Y4_NAUDC|nr:hypothetical protein NDAI_0A03650 [Naumovozyma dairenensis CBS 421]CCD22522.1 hypothetical protein NDAI_0A03650 [Naumovozyma dairenensis CBS 421]
MNVFKCLITFIYNVIKSSFNQRHILSLPLNFILNFLPVIIWLTIFDHAGLIPINIRPAIHSKIAFWSDQYLFGDWWGELTTQYDGITKYTNISYFTSSLFASIMLIILPLSIWYHIHYRKGIKQNLLEWYDDIFHFNNKTNPKRLRILLLPYLTPLITFIILNIDHIFAYQSEENFTKTKDLIAWFSYVILHVTVPILTAVYLYVFQPAGTLKCFSFALGLQNIAGVFTHLLIPMASPWFTHLYGINDTEHVNYTQDGFAAGLIRVDTHLGTHLNTKGFHMSPIVFGAVPSLHSAIAFQCALFLLTRSTSLKHRFLKDNHQQVNLKDESYGEDLEMAPLSLRGQSQDNTNAINNKTNSNSNSNSEDEGCSSLSSSENIVGSLNNSADDEEEDVDDLDSTKNEERVITYTPNQDNNNHVSLDFIHYYDENLEITNKWYFRIFNKGLVPKSLIGSFVILQWWATMYLDHHYRFDLFIGVLYSLTSFTIINWFILQPVVLNDFIKIRLGQIEDTKNEGKTLGMRVFQGTNYEWFF